MAPTITPYQQEPTLAPTPTVQSTSTIEPTVPLPEALMATIIPTATIIPPTATEPVQAGKLEVDYIDVVQWDSILLTTSSGRAMLIDGGEQGSGSLHFLQSKNIQHLDLVVATHPYSGYIGEESGG